MSFNWLCAKAETRSSLISGKGTYARKRIRKGELIAAFGGYVMEYPRWKDVREDVRMKALRVGDDLILGAIREDQLGDGDYINHSCAPNAGIKGQIFLVAMRDIRMGEEITFDYAMVLYGDSFRMGCNCGSGDCRKMIRSSDWKIPALQEKYDGYFSHFLQEKIGRRKKTRRPSRS